mmetsp:Transcript_9877/g.31335  ORF Transcript_9877/g.31335 Transcript_9877/m.31335 type:complete len:509 (-) Transcript_9877:1013-2539(-)
MSCSIPIALYLARAASPAAPPPPPGAADRFFAASSWRSCLIRSVFLTVAASTVRPRAPHMLMSSASVSFEYSSRLRPPAPLRRRDDRLARLSSSVSPEAAGVVEADVGSRLGDEMTGGALDMRRNRSGTSPGSCGGRGVACFLLRDDLALLDKPAPSRRRLEEADRSMPPPDEEVGTGGAVGDAMAGGACDMRRSREGSSPGSATIGFAPFLARGVAMTGGACDMRRSRSGWSPGSATAGLPFLSAFLSAFLSLLGDSGAGLSTSSPSNVPIPSDARAEPGGAMGRDGFCRRDDRAPARPWLACLRDLLRCMPESTRRMSSSVRRAASRSISSSSSSGGGGTPSSPSVAMRSARVLVSLHRSNSATAASAARARRRRATATNTMATIRQHRQAPAPIKTMSSTSVNPSFNPRSEVRSKDAGMTSGTSSSDGSSSTSTSPWSTTTGSVSPRNASLSVYNSELGSESNRSKLARHSVALRPPPHSAPSRITNSRMTDPHSTDVGTISERE